MKNIIYKPKGKAGEYAHYACNIFNGCSNECTYCYLNRFNKVFTNTPTLSKRFTNSNDALEKIRQELLDENGTPIKEYTDKGIMFSFTTDPFLKETASVNIEAMRLCLDTGIPVYVLTKMTDWVYNTEGARLLSHPRAKDLLAIGYTITDHDEMEPHADNNRMRKDALIHLSREGYLTWVSMEPIIDYPTALKAIRDCAPYVRMIKAGLLSGHKKPDYETVDFINSVRITANEHNVKIYWKESIIKCLKNEIPSDKNFIDKDWNIFKSNN